jgi:hypothetical protein
MIHAKGKKFRHLLFVEPFYVLLILVNISVLALFKGSIRAKHWQACCPGMNHIVSQISLSSMVCPNSNHFRALDSSTDYENQ